MNKRMMNKRILFVCVKETLLSGQTDPTKVGDMYWAYLDVWKSQNFINLFKNETPQSLFSESDRHGLGKSNCFIPLAKWREKQINSILSDD
jgi:hypothetical protein